MQKWRTFLAVVVLAICVPAAAMAARGYATAEVHLRAGPGTGYPVVATIPDGAHLNIHGCLNDDAWCDVSFSGARGWVEADYLNYFHNGQYVYLPDNFDVVGVPVVSFVFDTYWNRYYHSRPFFHRRAHWARYWRLHRHEHRRAIRHERRHERRVEGRQNRRHQNRVERGQNRRHQNQVERRQNRRQHIRAERRQQQHQRRVGRQQQQQQQQRVNRAQQRRHANRVQQRRQIQHNRARVRAAHQQQRHIGHVQRQRPSFARQARPAHANRGGGRATVGVGGGGGGRAAASHGRGGHQANARHH